MEEKEMGEITKLAYRTITDDLILSFEQSTPTAILDYLAANEDPIVIHDFICSGEIFMNLPKLIKRTMIESGLSKETDEDSDFCNTLYILLSEQNPKYKESQKSQNSTKRKISRWLDGTTKTIRYRYEAIEICFALKLDTTSTNNFLNKCGFVGLNIRDAKDAIYYYCILNKLPLSNAQKLFTRYNNEIVKKELPIGTHLKHDGQTTFTLEDDMLEYTDWDDDDAFFDSFLKRNKRKFISFSYSALNEYYILKNKLFFDIISNRLSSEYLDLDRYNKEHSENRKEDKRKKQYKTDKKINDSLAPEPKVTQKDIPISLSLKSALQKYDNNIELFSDLIENNNHTENELFIRLYNILNNSKERTVFSGILSDILDEGISHNEILLSQSIENSILKRNKTIKFLCKANINLHDNMFNEEDVFKSIISFSSENQDINTQKQLSLFLSDIISTEALLKYTIKSITDTKTNRIRKYTKSSFSETIMNEFPDDKSFANFEKDPSIINNGMTIRKMIILMYFIIYSYEYTRDFDDSENTRDINESNTKFECEDSTKSMIVEEFAFDEFTTNLNNILQSSRLPLLYPANQFDWLILRCIRQLEIIKYEDFEDDTAETENDKDDSPIAFFNAIIRYSFKKGKD